ncbi:MAG: sulfatase, partial [Planctomycetota bacterium]
TAFSFLIVVLLSTSLGAAEKPNVLFIAIDDLNDWVNCMGGRAGVHTPNLDRLAARGVLFANAHCAAPSCNPSRVAVMTGVAPYNSGVLRNGQDWRKTERLQKAVTLPEHFRSHGYRAVGAGKIFHVLSWIEDSYGKQQNDPAIWDEYFPSATRPMPRTLWPAEAQAKTNQAGYTNWRPIAKHSAEGVRRPPHFFDWAPMKEAESGMADHQVVDFALSTLKKESAKPLFQAVGIFRPHIPWFVPKKYFDLYPIDEVELPKIQKNDHADTSKVGQGFCRMAWHDWAETSGAWRGAVQSYLASISFADAQVGRLLDGLDASGRKDSTIIVLWSDHGMHIGEKRHWEKFTLWEESTRVPLMIVAPGVTKAGGVCREPVSLLDVYPTLNELCGLAKRDDIDGESLVPQLKDPKARRAKPAITSWHAGSYSVRTARFRYIHYGNGDRELYDHVNDPDEFTNLAKKEPAKWSVLMNELKRFVPKARR